MSLPQVAYSRVVHADPTRCVATLLIYKVPLTPTRIMNMTTTICQCVPEDAMKEAFDGDSDDELTQDWPRNTRVVVDDRDPWNGYDAPKRELLTMINTKGGERWQCPDHGTEYMLLCCTLEGTHAVYIHPWMHGYDLVSSYLRLPCKPIARIYKPRTFRLFRFS
jgi:hypothetical protein